MPIRWIINVVLGIALAVTGVWMDGAHVPCRYCGSMDTECREHARRPVLIVSCGDCYSDSWFWRS